MQEFIRERLIVHEPGVKQNDHLTVAQTCQWQKDCPPRTKDLETWRNDAWRMAYFLDMETAALSLLSLNVLALPAIHAVLRSLSLHRDAVGVDQGD